MKKKNRLSLSLYPSMVLALLLAGPSFAQDTLPPVSIAGFVDAFYSYNPAKPATGTNALRNFDVADNQFVVSQAEVSLSRVASPVGFHIDADYGPASDMIQSGTQGTLVILQQAFATAVLPVGSGLTLDAGKFFTGMGYEVVKTKDNFNYSRSFSFAWSIPYYHVGVRATYPVTGNLTSTLVVANGWNNTVLNRTKTFHLCLLDAPSPAVSFGVNWIGGQEEADSISKSFRNVVEGVLTLQPTENLTFAVDLTYGTEPSPAATAYWRAAVGYVKYQWTETSAFAIRVEGYWDPQGFTTGTVQDLSEVTATYDYRPAKSLILRAEYRHDKSTATVFSDASSAAANAFQNTFLLGVIVVF
ncbi:MAG TPA: porin [Bacteroidota bacterium]|nr:porin [Bacteroidota bacterium]